MNCFTCQTLIPDDARFCPDCGASLASPKKNLQQHAATGPTQRLPSPKQVTVPARFGEPVCWQCHGPMEQGFVPDFDDRTGGEPQYWVRGWPARNVQTGQIQIQSQDLVPLTAYRCPQCGLVLLYGR